MFYIAAPPLSPKGPFPLQNKLSFFKPLIMPLKITLGAIINRIALFRIPRWSWNISSIFPMVLMLLRKLTLRKKSNK